MDILQAYLSESPTSHLNLSFATLKTLCDSIQHIRWSERQMRALAMSAAQLLHILDNEFRIGRLAKSRSSLEIDVLQGLIKEISSFVQSEQGKAFLKLLFSKDERIAAIETYHRRLWSCANAFQISTLLNIKDWQKRNDDAREADRQLLDDFLTDLEANHLKLKEVLEIHQHNMVAMTTSLQKAVAKQLCGERERRFFTSTLNYLVEVSGQRAVDIESWMVTAFDVEFGPDIGSGGFGHVYKGVWNRTQVALKVLRTESGATPSLALIRREVRTWSTLLHPHILQFLGANVFDDRPFIVMPFLKNGNARDYVNDHPDCNRLMILHHISLGLVYLHHNNVIHGDLKALNVLIDDAGHAVLCDFGLSGIKCDASTRSMKQRNPSVVGSRNWMSPERIMGGTLRKPVDIYAFGMTMFEILTGQVPLGHIEYMDFIHLVVDLDVRPERPEDDQPFKISNALWSLAESCWTKNPQDRPPALAICDTISSHLASHSDASLQENIAATPLTSTTTTNMMHGAPPKYESGPLPSSPIYSQTVPISGSFSTTNQLSTAQTLSTTGRPDSLVVDVNVMSRGNLAFVLSPSPDGNTYIDPLNASGSSSNTISPSRAPTVAGGAHPKTTVRSLNPSQVYSSLRDGAEQVHAGRFRNDLTNRNGGMNQVSMLAEPSTTAESISTINEGHRTPRERSGDRSRPTTNSAQSFTSDAISLVESVMGESIVDVVPSSSQHFKSFSSIDMESDVIDISSAFTGPSSSNHPNPVSFKTSARVEPSIPDVPSLPRHFHRKQMSETIPAIGENRSEKRSGFNRMKNWFGKRPSTAPDQSHSPLHDISGFKTGPPRFSLPRSKPRLTEMWSLDDFLDRWMERSSDFSKDEEFQELFLMTYTVFATCLQVLEGLRQRFVAAAGDDIPAQIRAFKRHNVIKAIAYWVSSPYMPDDPDVLLRIKEFANSVTSSSFMREKAGEIAKIIDEKKENYPLLTVPAPLTKSRALLDNTPDEIAAALTTLEGVMFSRIRPADYIGHLREIQAPNRVADAIITTRKITFWVKQKVLRSDQIKTRGKAFKFFLQTAEACCQKRNFSSMAAIIVALESDLIQCLSETLEELGREDQKLLVKLKDSVKLESAYRMALISSEDPCVPRLEFHLRDLESVLPSCLPNSWRRSAAPINILGCTTLATSFRNIIKFRSPAMKASPRSEGLDYLMKQLDVIQVNRTAHDELRQRSRFVKAQETSFRGSRARALKDSGFA